MTGDPKIIDRELGRTRKGSGRQFGSKDRFPRGTKDKERAKLMEQEIARLRAKLDWFETRLIGNTWKGNIADGYLATARGEYEPNTAFQFYAMRDAWREGIEETRREQDEHRRLLETERAEYHDGAVTLDKLIEQNRVFFADRSAELAALIADGDVMVTPIGDAALRSWFVPDIFDPKPLALPAPAGERDGEPATTTLPNPTIAPAPLPARPAARFAALPGLEPVEPAEIVRVIWAPRPFAVFQVSSGKRFEANSAAEVELADADADDIKDLLRAGCRERK